MTGPHVLQIYIIFKLVALMPAFVEQHGLGLAPRHGTNFVLTDVDVFQPDVWFVRQSRYDEFPPRFHGAPDPAVEVLSPSI